MERAPKTAALRIADTVQDSIVDGPGLRFTVFTQGCPHHCPGCHNPETHDPAGGREATVEELGSRMASNPATRGLTLSGGDPFEQPGPCAMLARLAHGQGKDVWTYTGYTYEQLLAQADPARLSLLAETDVLVDGPFVQELKSYDALFRGSTNQRLIDLNETRRTGELTLWEKKDPLAHFQIPGS